MSNVAVPSRAYDDRSGVMAPGIWSGFRWSPVLAGVAIAIAFQLFLTMLGMAIGVSAAEPREPDSDAGSFGVAAGVWWLVSGTISLLIGGVVLGRAWGRRPGMLMHLHAVAMWAVVAIFGFFVIWSGVGMASETASPIAAIAGQQVMNTQNGAGVNTATDVIEDPAAAQAALVQATDAAQTAAWWSVVGLLIGIAASVLGGVLGSKGADDRDTARPAVA